MSRPCTLTATEGVAKIRAGELSAVAWLEDCYRQVDQVEPSVHAWTFLARETAFATARQVDEDVRAGVDLPLGGAPIAVKDIFNTIGMPTQMGSPLWEGFTPGNDARVLYDLRRSGGVFPGKTVTAEFAVHTPGPTKNPHAVTHMPGTSSSGSAVAVASYMVPLALGTQTAGSTIRPASYNGVYGLKPSFGLIPRTGMLKTTDSLDTVGLFARSVDDLALFLDRARVHGKDYPVIHREMNDPERRKPAGRPWRIAVLEGPRWTSAEPYAQTALHAFAEKLGKTKGFEVTPSAGPAELARAHDVHGVIYDKTLSYYFKTEFEKHTLISPVMYDIVRRGNDLTLEQYKRALADQVAIASAFDGFMKDFDAVLTLSTGGAALKGLDSVDRPDSCLVWTLCGAPAISLPVFTSPEGLPFGAQLVARKYSDLSLLELAGAIVEAGLAAPGPNPVPELAR